jgi:hypothetical protein
MNSDMQGMAVRGTTVGTGIDIPIDDNYNFKSLTRKTFGGAEGSRPINPSC